MVTDNTVTFNLTLGSGIVDARCEVLQQNKVLEEVNCKSIM